MEAKGGRDRGNKGEQVSGFKAKRERRGWRTIDSCSVSPEMTSDLQRLPDPQRETEEGCFLF